MFNKIKYILPLALLITLYYSCVKKTTYLLTPEIAFKSFTYFPNTNDSAMMVITYKDGDGDIGKETGDSTKNLYMNYYYKDTITQKYVAYYSTATDSLKTGYTIRKPDVSYKGKPISGEVAVGISKCRHSKKYKLIKYVIYMFDNAGNKSNVITTEELAVP